MHYFHYYILKISLKFMLKNLVVAMINHWSFFLGNHQDFIGAIIIKLLFLLIGNDCLFIEVFFLPVLWEIINSSFDILNTKFLRKVNYFRSLCFWKYFFHLILFFLVIKFGEGNKYLMLILFKYTMAFIELDRVPSIKLVLLVPIHSQFRLIRNYLSLY